MDYTQMLLRIKLGKAIKMLNRIWVCLGICRKRIPNGWPEY